MNAERHCLSTCQPVFLETSVGGMTSMREGTAGDVHVLK